MKLTTLVSSLRFVSITPATGVHQLELTRSVSYKSSIPEFNKRDSGTLYSDVNLVKRQFGIVLISKLDRILVFRMVSLAFRLT